MLNIPLDGQALNGPSKQTCSLKYTHHAYSGKTLLLDWLLLEESVALELLGTTLELLGLAELLELDEGVLLLDELPANMDDDELLVPMLELL